MKKGFGLLEVLIAAVVLGFLIVGLNKLQLGNREALLRLRARDAASFIAQHVLDSLGTQGINSIQKKLECGDTLTHSLVYCVPNYKYDFEGKGDIKTQINYDVKVELLPDPDKKQETEDKTKLIENDPSFSVSNTYAKNLQATVKWKYKGSDQSIQLAKVVR